MDRFDPFVKYADVYGDVINWEKDPMNKPQNQNKYFFSDGKTYYEQICKMLRLMSVFKQAFNQIYDNEDEIHTAWENFVDNLSATAVYGEEVGVNLTWTDTSVNFAFTIPGGQDGEDGVGIQSITFNSDYTMTITLTDGSTYTSESLRGAQGEQGIQGLQGPAGPQGEPGSGLEILDVYPTLQDLQTAHPTGSPGDAYQVGTAPSFTLYIWSASQSAWVAAGTIGSAVPSSADPLMDGIPSAGISDLYSRGDHVHPTDTSRASAQDLETVDDKVDAVDDRVDDISDIINTSQKLIDQSFVYRESPAEHDGLAVLDMIKGHTVKFNQIAQNGNFESTTGWTGTRGTITASNNELSYSLTELSAGDGNYIRTEVPILANHKYLFSLEVNVPKAIGIRVSLAGGNQRFDVQVNQINSFVKINGIINVETAYSTIFIGLNGAGVLGYSVGDIIKYKNIKIHDLTAIFGAGSEPATPEAFESWLSQNLGLLNYYAYTPGTLIPFKGTGLKTVGKNHTQLEAITTLTDGYVNQSNSTLGEVKKGIQYTLSLKNLTNSTNNINVRINHEGTNIVQTGKNLTPNGITTWTFTASDDGILHLSGQVPFSETKVFEDIMLEYGPTATDYELYTESTLDLSALNTLFPTGMKDAGSVYDEASETKAITRLGRIVLDGTQRIILEDYTHYRVSYEISDMEMGSTLGSYIDTNVISNYLPSSSNDLTLTDNAGIHRRINSTRQLVVGFGSSSGLNTATKINDYLSTNPLTVYYPLATPTEQDIDLDLSFKAYEGGTEQLLPVNGSTPITSSLLADMTYFSINDAMDYILAKLDQVHSSIASDINSLKTRMTSAEGNITSLGGRMTLAEDATLDLDQDISDISLILTRLRGKTVFEYLTDADQGYTTSQLDMTDLQNATHIEIIYTKSGTSNVMTTGLIPWKIFDATSVQFGLELAQAGLNEYKTRLLGISATGMLIINGCQVQTPDASPVIMNSLFIVRQVNLYRITKSNDIS